MCSQEHPAGLGGHQRDWVRRLYLGSTKPLLTLVSEAAESRCFSCLETVYWGRTVDSLLPSASPAHAVCHQSLGKHLAAPLPKQEFRGSYR